ncbi:hypothetical protein ACQPT2_09655 [Erwinia amylovora]
MKINMSLPQGLEGNKFSYGLRGKQLRAYLEKNVLTELPQLKVGENDQAGYPWCFVLPAGTFHKKYFYVGTFVSLSCGKNEGPLLVIYSRLTENILKKDFNNNMHQVYLQTRILAHLSGKSNIDSSDVAFIRQWRRALQRSTFKLIKLITPGWQLRFTNRKLSLFSDCCMMDYALQQDEGVLLMPWNNWPLCVRQSNKLWLWRLSKNGRIINAKKMEAH